MFPLSQLMPTEVEGKKKDYCHKCFKRLTNEDMSKSAFKIGVASLRAADKYAVTLDDAMVHATLENLIFNSYKQLRQTLEKDQARILTRIGDKVYHKLIMDCLRQHTEPEPGMDISLIAAQTLQDVISITVSAREALGKARLTTATKATEFMRVIVGSERSVIAAGGGYYCQTCWTQPKYDYHWTKAKKLEVP
jgi:hypothetical protein